MISYNLLGSIDFNSSVALEANGLSSSLCNTTNITIHVLQHSDDHTNEMFNTLNQHEIALTNLLDPALDGGGPMLPSQCLLK